MSNWDMFTPEEREQIELARLEVMDLTTIVYYLDSKGFAVWSREATVRATECAMRFANKELDKCVVMDKGAVAKSLEIIKDVAETIRMVNPTYAEVLDEAASLLEGRQ